MDQAFVVLKLLGIQEFFHSVMNLESHIAHVCTIAYINLRNIRKLRNVLTDHSAAQLIHVIISSRIDYCNSILYGMSDSIISDLQHFQNTAAKYGNSVFIPKYICDLITRRQYKQELRTNDQMNLVVPLAKRFFAMLPRECSKLELSIRKSEIL